MKNIMVIGGDGFCGWPLSLHLSAKGHRVFIVDNLSRRDIDRTNGTESLTPIADHHRRVEVWNKSGHGERIQTHILNVADFQSEYTRLKMLIEQNKIDTIVNLGEQRSAPYSMKNESTRIYTVNNNLNCNNNLLSAIVEVNPEIHLVHLGTMGVYGYGTVKDVMIPEGYIDVEYQGQNINILHPAYPGSIYHMTKTQDALFFQFYAKNYDLKITDLHQGIVWGVETPETKINEELNNRFDYDGDYGTVLNRFITQSSVGYPLTIYGTGGQTRAFININDSMKCIEMAINNPPERGQRPEIFNQVTETHRLTDLVAKIKDANPNTEISFIDNPRKELSENDLEVSNKKFIDLGLEPTLLSKEEILKIMDYCNRYSNRIKLDTIKPMSYWSKK